MQLPDQKINEHFAGLVVRKDLVKMVKGNAIVPTYVLEYLLGQYCATSDEVSIQSGIETVKEIIRKHYVHRNEANLIKSVIRERGRHKVIDKVSVALNEKTDAYEAAFSNLGINKVLIDSDTVRRHPKLLVSGVWCICDIEYRYADDQRFVPWILESIKPIQLSHFDYDRYVEARGHFSMEEWIDLLVQSIGFNPVQFSLRNKLLLLMRLVPYCERNYNLIELGPKGTGKSHTYSDFSPHGILISGGEVTVPKLFVNNATGKIGLVGYWDVVAFDEFAGTKKRTNKALVDIMKNYMANKSFSRGIETIGAEASMVFVGNTRHNVEYMLRHSNLFEELPQHYYDSAFLDRIHFYLPGWEVEILRGEFFSDGYGFVVDYLAEILRTLRNYDYSQKYSQAFALLPEISTRDRDGINKTFSGLMKILFPDGEASEDDIEMILKFAIEGRKRVKDQLMRIDPTYADVRFGYASLTDGKEIKIRTLEETQYPQHYYDKAYSEKISDEEPLPDPTGVTGNYEEELSLEDLIELGEGERLELKSTLQWDLVNEKANKNLRQAVLKTIVAFLNSSGGKLIIGVEDDGSIMGLSHDLKYLGGSRDKFQQILSSLITDKIGPEFYHYLGISFEELGEEVVCVVEAKRATEPAFLTTSKGKEFYVRVGNTSRALDPEKTMKYVQTNW
jgi:ATP-dependent Lon protease